MPEPTCENLPDGCVKVTLCTDDRCETTVVSSHHLVPDKIPQLERALAKELT
ncbi:MAG: hypothetical protein ACO23G_11395 [Limnohabitans sp.]